MGEPIPVRQEQTRLKQQYMKYRGQKKLFIIIIIPILCLLAALSVAAGSVAITPSDVFQVIANHLFPVGDETISGTEIIIWQLRLPRIFMGLLAGLALGATGAVMQVVLRNPLADPYMLGIASAAGFGASLALVFGIGFFSGSYLVIGNAFLFSLICSALILALSGGKGSSPESMVLTGLALLFFFQAMTTIIQYFGHSDAVKATLFWSVGDLGKADWKKLGLLFPLVSGGLILLFWRAGDLNVMNAGDATAKSLGINVTAVRIFHMVVCSLLVAGVVSLAGTIGFIGLVAPHIVRMIIGNDNRLLIPASALVGAVLLIISDTLARTVLSPVILPVGTITAFLGVPLLIFLIMKTNRTGL